MDKKIEIVLGKQPEVVEKIVKVPVRVNPKTTPEIVGDCFSSLCGVAALAGLLFFFYKATKFEPSSRKKNNKEDK